MPNVAVLVGTVSTLNPIRSVQVERETCRMRSFSILIPDGDRHAQIPCEAWREAADLTESMRAGETIVLEGRIRSRMAQHGPAVYLSVSRITRMGGLADEREDGSPLDRPATRLVMTAPADDPTFRGGRGG